MRRTAAILLMIALMATGLASCASNPVSPTTAPTSAPTSAPTTAPTSDPAATSTPAPTTDPAATDAPTPTAAATSTPAAPTPTPLVGKTYVPASASLTGTVSFSGSTSCYPAIAALTEAFKAKYPKVKILITNVTGSGAGLADAKTGTVSFGMRSSAWSIADGANINPYQFALDGVAVVVNTANNAVASDGIADNINTANLKAIYEGTDIFGITAPVNREIGSGTRTCFMDILKAASYRGVQLASTEAVAAEVAGNANAIGYISLGSVTSAVKVLSYNGIAATEANVLNLTYKFSRPFLLLRRNDRPFTAAEKEFLKFLYSADGQAIVHSSGFIKLSDALLATEYAKIP
jgi:phosphate transport system substrate-binding protein